MRISFPFPRSPLIFAPRSGVLNLIFFHRYFPSIRPVTFDVLDFTLPAINDADLETLIESRVSALVRQHLSSAAGGEDGKVGGGGGVRGRIAVEFYEKKRRRSGLWFGGLAGKGEEEVCWEIWTLDVTIATPRTDSGELFPVERRLFTCYDGILERRLYWRAVGDVLLLISVLDLERAKVRKAMGNMLQKAALKILAVVNRDKDHIPPITTSDSNPFPYRIVVNPRTDGWGNRIGLY